MLESLKKQVYQANIDLLRHQLVVLTWGNVSARDASTNYIVIKPSGVSYDQMKPEDMVVVDIEGNIVEGHLKPSSDTLTHLEIYKAFKDVGAVIHTHSKWATTFAQAKLPIPPLGTTHADYFNQEILVTRALKSDEIEQDYELNTGKVIVELFEKQSINPIHCPAVLVYEHGPFVWGKSIDEALTHAVTLEVVAEMAYHTIQLNQHSSHMQASLLKKHFERKHGKHAYYGQKKGNHNF